MSLQRYTDFYSTGLVLGLLMLAVFVFFYFLREGVLLLLPWIKEMFVFFRG